MLENNNNLTIIVCFAIIMLVLFRHKNTEHNSLCAKYGYTSEHGGVKGSICPRLGDVPGSPHNPCNWCKSGLTCKNSNVDGTFKCQS